jgi:formate hydrogenlyase subunit 6/NADH:ubiquinone oxidoreductase subunit I
MDQFVKNTVALQSFQEQIANQEGPVPTAIRYHVPECFLCWQCIGACPKHAIDVEYDDLDVREYSFVPEESPQLVQG